MPTPNNRRAQGAATQRSQQSVAPQGTVGDVSSPVGSIASSGGKGPISIGQQARIGNPGTGLADALGGLNRGMQLGTQAYAQFEKMAAESDYADFMTAYQQEVGRVNGNATKLNQWMESQTYKPNRLTAQRYWGLRSQIKGKSVEEYEAETIADYQRRISSMTPDEQLQFLSNQEKQWDTDSQVYKWSQNNVTKLRGEISAANQKITMSQIVQGKGDEINRIGSSLLERGIVTQDQLNTGYMRRTFEAIALLQGTEGFSFDEQAGTITLDGETRRIGSEAGPLFDGKLQQRLAEWGSKSAQNTDLLLGTMRVSVPRLGKLDGMSPGEREQTYETMISSAFQQGNEQTASINEVILPAFDKFVPRDEDPAKGLGEVINSIASRPGKSVEERQRALVAFDGIFDYEANEGWWNSRGIDSQEQVDRYRKNSGFDDKMELLTLEAVETMNKRTAGLLDTSQPGNTNVLNPAALAEIQQQQIRNTVAALSVLPSNVGVTVDGTSYTVEKFESAVASGDVDLSKSGVQIRITGMGDGPVNRMNLTIPVGDDLIVIGDGSQMTDKQKRALEANRGQMQLIIAEANHFQRVVEFAAGVETGAVDPALRPSDLDVRRAIDYALGTNNVGDAYALLSAQAYAAEPLISGLTQEQKKVVRDFAVGALPPSQAYPEGLPAVSAAGATDLIEGRQTPAAERIRLLSTELRSNTKRSNELRDILQDTDLGGDEFSMWLLTDGVNITDLINKGRAPGQQVTMQELQSYYQRAKSPEFSNLEDKFDGSSDVLLRVFRGDAPDDATDNASFITRSAIGKLESSYADEFDGGSLLNDLAMGPNSEEGRAAYEWATRNLDAMSSTNTVLRALANETTGVRNVDELALVAIDNTTITGNPRGSVAADGPVINSETYDPSNQGRTIEEQAVTEVYSRMFSAVFEQGNPSTWDASRRQAQAQGVEMFNYLLRGVPKKTLRRLDSDERLEFAEIMSVGDVENARMYLVDALIDDGLGLSPEDAEQRAGAALARIFRNTEEMISIVPNQALTGANSRQPAQNGYFTHEQTFNVRFNREHSFFTDYRESKAAREEWDQLFALIGDNDMKVNRIRFSGDGAVGEPGLRKTQKTMFISPALSLKRRQEAEARRAAEKKANESIESIDPGTAPIKRKPDFPLNPLM